MPPTTHLLAFTLTAFLLGVQAIRHRRRLAEALGTRLENKSIARIVTDGFVVGVGNPKVIVFFAAVLPQFVDRTAGHVTAQLLVLGALFAGITLISDSAWAVAAGSARAWLGRSPPAARADRRHRRPGHDRHRDGPGRLRPPRLSLIATKPSFPAGGYGRK